MAAPGDLTSLVNVKQWLGITNNNSDQLLSRLITAISGTIRDICDRSSFVSQPYTDVRSGSGTQNMLLRNWPVTSVEGLSIGGAVVTPGTYSNGGSQTAGWYLEPWDGYTPDKPQILSLIGWQFSYGLDNVLARYTAGYLLPFEPAVVPSTPYQVTVLAPLGPWSADNGVVYAGPGGLALQRVAANPGAGQYSINYNNPGVYTFAAADAAANVLISYSYTPAALEQVAIEWIGERNSYRSRIGVRSKNLAGQESISYDLSGVPSFIASALQPFMNVVPQK